MIREICEVTYTFEYNDANGNPGKVSRTFRTDDGDWLNCHGQADKFSKALEEKGNKVHHLKHINSASQTINDRIF